MSSHGDSSELNGSFCRLLLLNRYAIKTLPYRLSLPPTRFETFEVAFNGKVCCDCKQSYSSKILQFRHSHY